MDNIEIHCYHCEGGRISECCEIPVWDGRCECGKFAREVPCYYCEGDGYNRYYLGQQVDIFVCIYSSKEVKKLYKPKKLGDTKCFKAKIIKLKNNTCIVKPRKQDAIEVKYEEINI